MLDIIAKSKQIYIHIYDENNDLIFSIYNKAQYNYYSIFSFIWIDNHVQSLLVNLIIYLMNH